MGVNIVVIGDSDIDCIVGGVNAFAVGDSVNVCVGVNGFAAGDSVNECGADIGVNVSDACVDCWFAVCCGVVCCVGCWSVVLYRLDVVGVQCCCCWVGDGCFAVGGGVTWSLLSYAAASAHFSSVGVAWSALLYSAAAAHISSSASSSVHASSLSCFGIAFQLVSLRLK